MVAGMVYGDDTGENREAKSYTYKKVQEIAAEFKKTNPSIICRELLGLSKKLRRHSERRKTHGGVL